MFNVYTWETPREKGITPGGGLRPWLKYNLELYIYRKKKGSHGKVSYSEISSKIIVSMGKVYYEDLSGYC